MRIPLSSIVLREGGWYPMASINENIHWQITRTIDETPTRFYNAAGGWHPRASNQISLRSISIVTKGKAPDPSNEPI